MKFIPGRGAASRKFAAWANKVHSGSLGKYIQPSRGMQVLTTGEIGVSLAATGADIQSFRLSALRDAPSAEPVNALVCGPSGSVVGPTSTPVYFTFTPSYYRASQVVLCMNIMGQWEVFSPGYPCPEEEDGGSDSADGGTWAAGGDTEDGGSWAVASGDLDGGVW